MDIKQALEQEHSKAQNKRIINYIGNDSDRFEVLMQLVLGSDKKLAQRAAWAMSGCAIDFPELIISYQHQLLTKLKEPHIHDAIKRNILRTWVHQIPPEELWGELFDTCYQLARSKDEPGAIRAFSLYVMGNIATHYPDLAHEVRALIEDLKAIGTPAILASGKKVLKQLKKI